MAEEFSRLQIRFEQILNRIELVNKIYDEGNYSEAIALSALIDVLVGDRSRPNATEKQQRQGSSLTKKLGCKPQNMVDLSFKGLLGKIPDTFGPIYGMGFFIWGCKGLAPILDGQGPQPWTLKMVPFEEWWQEKIIIRDALGNKFTRSKLVKTIRDQEESHVDEFLEKDYESLAYKGSLGVAQTSFTTNTLDENPAFVALRQISHEILRTFRPQMPIKLSKTNGALIAPYPIVELYRYKEHQKKPKKITTSSFERTRMVKKGKEPKDSLYQEASHHISIDGLAFSIMQKDGEEIFPVISIANINNIAIPNMKLAFKRFGAVAWEAGPVGFLVKLSKDASYSIDADQKDGWISSDSKGIPDSEFEFIVSLNKL